MKEEEVYQLRIDIIDDELRFNRQVIKKIQQRNTELKYIKAGLEKDMKERTK